MIWNYRKYVIIIKKGGNNLKKITKKINFEKNRIKKIARNKKKRKNKKYNPNKNYFLQPIKSSNAKMLRTKVQKILEKNNFIKKIDIESNKAIIRIPKEFCFIRNPEQTLDVLKRINYFLRRQKLRKYSLIIQNVNYLD